MVLRLIHFLLLLIASGWPVPADAGQVRSATDKVGYLLVKLEWDEFDPYYATALLFDLRPDQAFFLVNAHSLPRDRSRWNKLYAKGVALGTSPSPIQIEAVAPGYDLAVISTPRTPSSNDKLIAQYLDEFGLTKAVNTRDWEWRFDPKEPLHAALVGVPGLMLDSLQLVQPFPWQEEMEFASRWDMPAPAGTAPVPRLSTQRIPIEQTSLCPPPFLEKCLLVSLRSWGFSGGVLLSSIPGVDPKDRVELLGLVSHFSPFAESTYAIPIEFALGLARTLLERKRGGTYILDTNLSGSMRLNGKGVQLLTGPLRGEAIEMPTAFAAGGGESSGGGGESSGGGGESSGGGGESSGGGGSTLVESATGNAYLHSYLGGPSHVFFQDKMGWTGGIVDFEKLLQQLEKPLSWAERGTPYASILSTSAYTKGGVDLLAFRPGVVLDGKTYFRYGPDKEPIVNRSHFLSLYRQNPSALLESSFETIPLPRRMIATSKDKSGFFATTKIERFRSVDELSLHLKIPEDYERRGLLGGDFLLVNALPFFSKLSNPKDPLSAVRIVTIPFGLGAIREGRWITSKGGISLSFLMPRWGIQKVVFPDKFIQESPLVYRYTGPIVFHHCSALHEDTLDSTAVSENAFVHAIIQRSMNSPEEFEIKFIASYKNVPSWAKEEENEEPELYEIITPKHSIYLEGFYLTMRADASPESQELPSIPWTLDKKRAQNQAFEKMYEAAATIANSEHEQRVKNIQNVLKDPEELRKYLRKADRVLLTIQTRLLPDKQRKELESHAEEIERADNLVAALENRLDLPPYYELHRSYSDFVESLNKRVDRVHSKILSLSTEPTPTNLQLSRELQNLLNSYRDPNEKGGKAD